MHYEHYGSRGLFPRCPLMYPAGSNGLVTAESTRQAGSGSLSEWLRLAGGWLEGGWRVAGGCSFLSSWPYAVFAINNAASTLGGNLTPFFIDRGRHPRLPLSLPDLRSDSEPPSAYAARMKALEQEVLALLHAAQQERKAALDRGRVDTRFQVGDQVMLRTKELLDAAEIGKLRPRWEGPFPVVALAGPNTYTLALPKRFQCSPTVNVDRLKPYHRRTDRPDAPGPVAGGGPQAGEYVVEQLLNRKVFRGKPYYLVRWQGHASADDSWEPVENLNNCPERLAEYEAAAHRRPKARRVAARGGAAPPPPPPVPTQPSVAIPPHPPCPPPAWVVGPAAPPVVGASLLYWWPEVGWQFGRVARLSKRTPFSHVVRYRRPAATFAGDVDTLLDATSYGTRWVLLAPARA